MVGFIDKTSPRVETRLGPSPQKRSGKPASQKRAVSIVRPESDGYKYKVDKTTVEKAVDTASFIVLMKGVVTTVISAIKLAASKVKDLGKNFTKYNETYGFGFDALDSVISVYSLYDDGHGLVKAYKGNDPEEFKDRSISFTSSGINVAGAGIGTAAFTEGLKESSTEALARSAALGVSASAIGITIWGIFLATQTMLLNRIRCAKNSFKKAFLSQDTKKGKYEAVVKDLLSQIEISGAENSKIQDKVQHIKITKKEALELREKVKGFSVESQDSEFEKLKSNLILAKQGEKTDDLRKKLFAKKHNRLRKRVGQEMAEKIISEVSGKHLLDRLNSPTAAVESQAMQEVGVIIQDYKKALNKEFMVTSIKLVASMVGLAGAIVALSNPIGAGIISGVATGFLIYSWYVGQYKKPEAIKDISIAGWNPFSFLDSENEVKAEDTAKKVNELVVPTAKDVQAPTLIVEDFSAETLKKRVQLIGERELPPILISSADGNGALGSVSDAIESLDLRKKALDERRKEMEAQEEKTRQVYLARMRGQSQKAADSHNAYLSSTRA